MPPTDGERLVNLETRWEYIDTALKEIKADVKTLVQRIDTHLLQHNPTTGNPNGLSVHLTPRDLALVLAVPVGSIGAAITGWLKAAGVL